MWRLRVGMEARAFLGRMAFGLAGTAAGLLLLAFLASADETGGAGATRAGVVVYDAAETDRRFCRLDESGAMWLSLPDGGVHELITTPLDPVLLNAGDGEFHPFDPAEVRAALDAVRFPLEQVPVEIYILPYPRRSGLESAAGPGIVLLAPGVRALAPEQQHAILVHELGHVVQHARIPDHDVAAWRRYRALRGITDEARYCAASPHADRPHEIFAEDFRALFGGPLATTSGTIENATLAPPATVTGLAEFIAGLAGAPRGERLAAWPNPARGRVALARTGEPAGIVDLFDVGGRRIASLGPEPVAGGWRWVWDGALERGGRRAAGVVLARERGSSGPATRITLLR
jgi:hypothetical protein